MTYSISKTVYPDGSTIRHLNNVMKRPCIESYDRIMKETAFNKAIQDRKSNRKLLKLQA